MAEASDLHKEWAKTRSSIDKMRESLELPLSETPEDDQIALEALTRAGKALADQTEYLLGMLAYQWQK